MLLLERDPAGWWEALVRPSRPRPPGHRPGRRATTSRSQVGGPGPGDGTRQVTLRAGGDDELAALARHGVVPLPPYITAPLADPERYQTVFADRPGSVAAPTAGLHLTPAVLDRCREAGATVVDVELVVGLGTFRPGHGRQGRGPPHARRALLGARGDDGRGRGGTAAGGRVVAVGTTSVRALESAAISGERTGRTELFIHRPWTWRAVDVLLTNFHLPRSSLLVLLDAFVGARWRSLYDEALAEGYRFLSFGDAMVVATGMTLSFAVDARCGAARTGTVTTARGSFATPCFMPVGTRGAVRTLASDDLEDLGAEIVLGNTYHLMLRPGADVVAAARRAARLQRLVGAPPHRLGRLPGVLARAQGRRRGRHVRVDLRRQQPPPQPRGCGRRPGGAGQRHPDGARRLPAPARRPTR